MGANKTENDVQQCLTKWLNEDGAKPIPILKNAISSAGNEDISPSSVYVDILAHSLQFAHNQGLNQRQIKTFVLAFNSILNQSVVKGMEVQDAVELVRSQLTKLFAIGCGYPMSFGRSAIDYITRTLLQHYHLIQFVLTQDRDEDLTLLMEDVEVPPQTELLKLATPLAQWELETKLREKEEKFAQEKKLLEEKFAEIKSRLAEEIDEYMCSQDLSQLSSSGLLDIIERILSKHAELTAKDLDAVIEGSRQAVCLNMERNKLLNADKKVVSADKKSQSAEKKK